MDNAHLKPLSRLAEFLICRGIRELVYCPGSRNAPILFSLQAQDAFKIFRHFDERAAAFFAIGLCQSRGKRPVAVISTSGTAAAELLPACVEAHYQNLPLLLITADRPPRFRGSGAPQSIEQMGIYSHYAPSIDWSLSDDFPEWNESSPLHLNVCLEEPREGDWLKERLPVLPATNDPRSDDGLGIETLKELQSFCENAESFLVLVGSLPRENAKVLETFLAKLRAPVLADATSNLSASGEHSSYLLKCGDRLLKRWKPERVLRFGAVPSCRFWRDLEESSAELMCVSFGEERGRYFPALSRPVRVLRLSKSSLLDWDLERKEATSVHERDSFLAASLEGILQDFPLSELAMVRALKSLQKGLLYLGNSLPIREWNLVNGVHENCFANRGANGIDGQVSTFLGLSEFAPEAWALVGDQTALYDLNALALGNQDWGLKDKKRRLVVINNSGGKIFSHLAYSKSLDSRQRRYLENPHRWSFRAWAEFFAWSYEVWERDDFFFDPAPDDSLLELRPDATQSQAFWKAWSKVEG